MRLRQAKINENIASFWLVLGPRGGRFLPTHSQLSRESQSRVANSQAAAQAGFNDMPIVVAIKIFVINYKYVEIAAAA